MTLAVAQERYVKYVPRGRCRKGIDPPGARSLEAFVVR